MEFLGQLAEKYVEQKLGVGSHQQQQQSPAPAPGSSSGPAPGYGGGYGPPGGAPDQNLPYPWVARWDERDQRYFYLNEQTGERTWNRPGEGGYVQPPPPPQQPYGGGGYGYGQPQPPQSYGYPQEPPKKDHSLAYGAAGLVAGGLVAYEGEKIYDNFEQDKLEIENFPENAAQWTGEKVGEVEQIPQNIEQGWDQAEYRVDNDINNAVNDVENFPENAAQWTGEKVGEVEQIPENIEQGFDRAEDRVENEFDDAVNDVENFPENAAEWVGDEVGGVERFGDEMENAYDAGEAEGRDGW